MSATHSDRQTRRRAPIQLADDNRCLIFGQPERPRFCGGLQPSADMCGDSREYAIRWLGELEQATRPH